VLIAESDPDVRLLLALAVARVGHQPVMDGEADAVVLEPACPVARAKLACVRDTTPVVCVSIYPRENGFEPPETVHYLEKPVSTARLGAALADALSS
jgi:hypothetical protein